MQLDSMPGDDSRVLKKHASGCNTFNFTFSPEANVPRFAHHILTALLLPCGLQLGILPGVKPHLKVYALPGQRGSTTMQVCTGVDNGGCNAALISHSA